MRVDSLHRKIADDVLLMHDAVTEVFPVQMPRCYETRAMNVTSFLERLNAVTTKHDILNERRDDKTIDPYTLFHTGLWLGFDELPENESNADIRVLWHIHPYTKRVMWTQAEWNRRRYYFWAMVMHELVHRHQDVYRTMEQGIKQFRVRSEEREAKKDQAYYGNYDELEAHAHDAAVEFITWWPHLSLREATQEANKYTGRLVIPTYNYYTAAFHDTPGHPAVPSFKRKMKSWYIEMKKHPDIYETLRLQKLA